MPLTYAEVYERLKKSHPQDILRVEEVPGDAFAVVRREGFLKVCRTLRDDPELKFDFCSDVAGVDDTKTFWAVYHLRSLSRYGRAVLKVDAGRENPWVPSVCDLWPGANWHERETYDMFGIRFEGHPDLRRILLPEDWVGHPLRKDYDYPDEYQGIPLK